MTLFKWSQTAATNDDVDSTINWQEGQAPSTVNNSARAMMAAIAKYRDDSHGNLVAGGTSTAMTLTTSQTFTALTDGIAVTCRMSATSGATPTLNVDSLGAKSIASVYGTAIPTGALLNGGVYTFVYDSTDDKWIVHGIFGPAAFGLGTGDSPQFTAINLGHASDTTLARSSAGNMSIEGNLVYRAGGTDVPVADGGTGASTAADARTNLGIPEVFLTSGTVSAAATLDIVLTSYTGYRAIKLVLTEFLPASDGVSLYLRVSTDGGSNYDAGASDYNWTAMNLSDASAAINFDQSGAATHINLTGTSAPGLIGSAATEGYSGTVTIWHPESATLWTKVQHDGVGVDSNATPRGARYWGHGAREAAQNTDAVRVLFSSGNIASGKYAVIGVL